MTGKLLCVDDDSLVLRCLTGCLKQQKGIVVKTARSGQEALEIEAAHGPFDLIISDYHMPGMNGIDLLRRMRELRPGTPRVLYSADLDQSEVTDVTKEGTVSRFYTKSLTCADIDAMITDAWSLVAKA